MMKRLFALALLGTLFTGILAEVAQAQTTQFINRFRGNIEGAVVDVGGVPTEIIPTERDTINFVIKDSGLEGVGISSINFDREFHYNTRVVKDVSFSGTVLNVVLGQGQSAYQMTYDGENPYNPVFQAASPAPAELIAQKDLIVGDRIFTREPQPDPGDLRGQPGEDFPQAYDADFDGFFTEKDVDMIKDRIASDGRDKTYDFNGDNRVDSRDMITVIRDYRKRLFRSRTGR